MSGHKEYAIGDIAYFHFAANATTGSADDGATPLYDVRLCGAAVDAAPTASGTPDLLTHANYGAGLYEIAVDTAGYAAGEYAVYCTLTVSTVNPGGFCGSFKLRAAGLSSYALLTDIDAEVDDIHAVVHSITVTGSALTKEASAFVKTTGGTEVNAYTDTAINNGTLHGIPAASTTIDVYYQFAIGTDSAPAKVNVTGLLTESLPIAENINMYAYRWDSPGWELIHTNVFTGVNSSTVTSSHSDNLLSRHVEAGVGTVRIRFAPTGALTNTTTILRIDGLTVEYAESVTAAVALIKAKTDYLPSVTAGGAGGVFIAGSNAATSVTTALTANITGNLSGSVGSVTGAVGSVTGAVGSVAGAVGSVTGAVGSVTGAVGSVTGAVGSVTSPVTVGTNTDKTGYALTVAPPTADENADALLARNVSGGSSAGRTVKQALHFLRNKWSISGATLTVTDVDDSTPSWTATVSTDAAADPVVGSDPAP